MTDPTNPPTPAEIAEIIAEANRVDRLCLCPNVRPVCETVTAGRVCPSFAALLACAEPGMPECAWTEDENEGYWESACGGAPWSFNDGGPVENNMKHCHKCGRIIRAAAVDGQDAKPSATAGEVK